jgi:hypothetical protein
MSPSEDLRTRCAVLGHKCVLLRQIHSNRLNHYKLYDNALNLGTISVASFLTFIGFFGLDKIDLLINLIYPATKEIVELGYNLAVFFVLLFSLFNVAFQFKEKVFSHWRAINLITDFVTDLDDILSRSEIGQADVDKQMQFVNYRYKHIADILPPSTDRDYFRAKRALAKKDRFKNKNRTSMDATRTIAESGIAENSEERKNAVRS